MPLVLVVSEEAEEAEDVKWVGCCKEAGCCERAKTLYGQLFGPMTACAGKLRLAD
jgi:hypothetical protein